MNVRPEFDVVEVVYSYSIEPFKLSEEAVTMYLDRRPCRVKHTKYDSRARPRVYCMCYGCVYHSSGEHIKRDDPTLVSVVKELGEKAAGKEVLLLIAEAVKRFYYVDNRCGCRYGCGIECIEFKRSSNLCEVNDRAFALYRRLRNSDVVTCELQEERKKIHEKKMLDDPKYAEDYAWFEYEMLVGGSMW
jgi:hypothetical protein